MDKENPIPYQHTLSSNMSAHSAPSSMASPSLAGSISPSMVSAPENTLTSCSPTPQLAIRSQPILDNDNDSVVNYNRSVVEEDEDTGPPGYLVNDPQSRVFYPIYLQNPQYSQGSTQPRMMLAKYIKYSTDYRYAFGMLKKGGEIRDTPVQIGRRARHFTQMTEANWRDLMRGNEKEFAINKALTEMGDLRLWGEFNTFRGTAELKKTLEEMLKDVHGQVREVMRELIKVETQYEESKKRLEQANAYYKINDKFHTIFGLSPRPRRVIRSPDITPITPTLHGPNEMPVLMDEDSRRNRKCHRCRQYGHVVQDCPILKGSKPRQRKNKRAVCVTDAPFRVLSCYH